MKEEAIVKAKGFLSVKGRKGHGSLSISISLCSRLFWHRVSSLVALHHVPFLSAQQIFAHAPHVGEQKLEKGPLGIIVLKARDHELELGDVPAKQLLLLTDGREELPESTLWFFDNL
jgi:hypothetical protein